MIKFPSCEGRGIYALKLKGEVVYIGKSSCNLFARLGRHVRDKKFDAVEWVFIEPEFDLDAVEREMIKELRPVYNSMHK